MSETNSCRPYLERFLVGPKGVDIGFGGDPINKRATTVDKDPGTNPDICCDAATLAFTNDVMDWVYSSHCLEDFEDTTATLKEWLRVLKPGGNLVLFLPDQQAYLMHCEKHGVLPNQDHKHVHFNIELVMDCLKKTEVWNRVIHYEYPVTYNPYSFALVCRKL